MFDFVFAGILIFGTGLTYEFVAKRGGNAAYRAATGIALATAFLLVWINGAVGVIGGGDLDSPNALYFGVLLLGLVAALVAHFTPRGMSRALFITATAQFLAPVIAIFIWSPQTTSWAPGVFPIFILNGLFVLLFTTSALLYRHAART